MTAARLPGDERDRLEQHDAPVLGARRWAYGRVTGRPVYGLHDAAEPQRPKHPGAGPLSYEAQPPFPRIHRTRWSSARNAAPDSITTLRILLRLRLVLRWHSSCTAKDCATENRGTFRLDSHASRIVTWLDPTGRTQPAIGSSKRRHTFTADPIVKRSDHLIPEAQRCKSCE